MTIQKNTSCPFCFSDLLFMGHIFNYLKEKCSARNAILIIKSFIWENVTLQKAASPYSYQSCKGGGRDEENHKIRYTSKFTFCNSHKCILDSYCLCALRNRALRNILSNKTLWESPVRNDAEIEAKSPIGRVLLYVRWLWNENSPDLKNMVFLYSSSF